MAQNNKDKINERNQEMNYGKYLVSFHANVETELNDGLSNEKP